jgi:hypothetical protein
METNRTQTDHSKSGSEKGYTENPQKKPEQEKNPSRREDETRGKENFKNENE